MYNTKSEPNVNYGVWVIMMCQCSFINCNKCATLVQDADSGRCSSYVGPWSIWELSVFSAQFCYEPKIALKISLFQRGKSFNG